MSWRCPRCGWPDGEPRSTSTRSALSALAFAALCVALYAAVPW